MVVSDLVMEQLYSKISCCARTGISVALRTIRPDASICETYVIYDGSMDRADKVKSMYRYSK